MGGIVSGIGNLLGGGANNSGFQAQAAGIQNPFETSQGQAAQGQVTNAYNQQQNLAQALQNQNGIGNQSSVFNQQQGLANALQQQANGQGINPAQAQLAQNTSANTANQAALMAGQRGASQNVGLIARQAAQQGAANQQGAVGQAATLEAQQQLAAQQQLQQQQQNLAGLATQQVGQQQGAVGALGNLALNNQNQVLGAYQGINTANVANAGQQNSANSALAVQNSKNSAQGIGGLANSLGGAAAGPLNSLLSGPSATSSAISGADALTSAAEDAGVAVLAGGGMVENPKLKTVSKEDRYPGHLYPAHMKSMAMLYHPHKFAYGGEAAMAAKKEGKDPHIQALPKEVPTTPIMQDGKQIGEKPLPSNFEQGGKVPGEASVKGNSYANDKVPALLSPKEIVIPRSITMAEDAPEKAKQFVAEQLQKHYKPEHKDFKEALKVAMKSRKEKK